MQKCKTKIYIADVSCLEDGAVFNALYNKVGKKRQSKIDKLRFESDKRLSLGAELLLKKALCDCGVDYKSINLDYGENGKPYIQGNELYFSLSHSGNMACCAVSKIEIGVDIEQISRANPKIEERIFTESERRHIKSDSDFIRLWTLKESYMKYCGSGLSISPKDIEIEFIGNIPQYKGLNFFEYETDGYKIALCGDGKAELQTVDLRD